MALTGNNRRVRAVLTDADGRSPAGGRLDDEIVPLPSVKLVQDKETGEVSEML